MIGARVTTDRSVNVCSIQVGGKVRWQEQTWTVTALSGVHATLSSPGGDMAVSIETLIAEAAPIDDDGTIRPRRVDPDLIVAPVDIPKSAVEDAAGWLRDCQAIEYGHEAGVRFVGETPTFPTSMPVQERVARVAERRGVSARTVQRKLAGFRSAGGWWGLLDDRTKRRFRAQSTTTDQRVHREQVEAAMHVVLLRNADESTLTKEVLRDRTQAVLDAEHGPGVVSVPPQRTFDRWMDQIAPNYLSLSAKSRRNRLNSPTPPFGELVATRPGEYVLFDATRSDVIAFDPEAGCWVNTEIVAAIDLYSRCVLAVRVCPTSATGTDCALLLHDILTIDPVTINGRTPTRPAPHVGVPEAIVFPYPDHDMDGLVATTGIVPESVVIDRGRIFTGDTFLGACNTLGINVVFARVGRPTDKPQIERWFRTLREQLLVRLDGYKGPSVNERGLNVESNAYYTVDELAFIVLRWTFERYNHTRKDLLKPSHQPRGVGLSPVEMLRAGIARTGRIRLPVAPGFDKSLLPAFKATINRDGIQRKYLRYDAPVLHGDLPHPNAMGETGGGRHTFRYNPADVSRVWFQHPETHEWSECSWRGMEAGDPPFDDTLVAYLHDQILDREHEVTTPAIEEYLRDLLDRARAGTLTPGEHRAATRARLRRQTASVPNQHKPVHLHDTLTPGTDTGRDELVDDLDRSEVAPVLITPRISENYIDDELHFDLY